MLQKEIQNMIYRLESLTEVRPDVLVISRQTQTQLSKELQIPFISTLLQYDGLSIVLTDTYGDHLSVGYSIIKTGGE